MAIKDLQARQTNVEIEGEIIEMGDVREFSKFGRQGRVANAIIKDDSGTVKLSLWNEQIDQVKKGDYVKIHKGYVSEFQGELQLTTGKFGSLEIGQSGGEPTVVEEKPPEEKPKPTKTEGLDVEEEDFF